MLTRAKFLPLWLRQKIYYRLHQNTPPPQAPWQLEFASETWIHHGCPTDLISRSIAFTGFYELELSRSVSKLAKKRGGLMVDVGANIGYFTHLWMNGRLENRVIAFEASPSVFKLLQKNISKQTWRAQTSLHQQAASNKPGKVTFDPGPPQQTGWGGIATSAASGLTVEVEATTLDVALKGIERVDFLKVDVEGADPLVIMGAEKLFVEKRIRAGIFEINPSRMHRLNISETDAVDLLRKSGYQVNLAPGECTFSLPHELKPDD